MQALWKLDRGIIVAKTMTLNVKMRGESNPSEYLNSMTDEKDIYWKEQMIPVINNMCGMQTTPYSLPYMKQGD